MQAAVAFALAENELLGLQPPVFARAPAVAEPELKPTKVARASAKKRVVRVKREPRPPHNAWAYSRQGGIFGAFFR